MDKVQTKQVSKHSLCDSLIRLVSTFQIQQRFKCKNQSHERIIDRSLICFGCVQILTTNALKHSIDQSKERNLLIDQSVDDSNCFCIDRIPFGTFASQHAPTCSYSLQYTLIYSITLRIL